ncbi:restriction endonuclease subunit S [Pseudomonas viridiflava]|uniref:restriction endonuclease subunit S n=1 Tax=Pseudomonas viridiflava TaxID=33069 RepID=UPI000F04CBBF|nr:restriction endonuclease subunit S [Pseudomonas viridiflava]
MTLYKDCYSYQLSDYFKCELPTHWLEKRLGYLAKEDKFSFVDGPFGSDLKSSDYKEDGTPLIQLNNIRDSKHVMQNMKFIAEEKKQQLLRHLAIPGDIVIAKMADPVARAAVVADDFDEYIIVADCVKYSPNLELINLDYLVWAINSDCVRENAELVSTGTTRVRINLGELKKLKIPFPPYVEQICIAAFLNHETTKVDALIEKQKKLIKLLTEKRQALISHAVTKGLNLNAKMRNSGVEWLGEVPESWTICRIKQVAKLESGHTPDKKIEAYWVACDIPWVSLNDSSQLKEVDYISDTAIYLNEKGIANSSARKLPERCVVFTRDASIGLAAITTRIMAVSQHVIAWICNEEKVIPEFLLLVFYAMKDELERYTFGATLKTIGMPDVNKLTAAFPDIEEQKIIVDYVFKARARLDLLISKSENAIALIIERRNALISAAVTGKIDVRDWVASEKASHNKEVAA